MDNKVIERIYKSSTFFLAQDVLRKNFSEELMLGLLIKQFILIIFPRSSQPKWCTSSLLFQRVCLWFALCDGWRICGWRSRRI